jgi:hypothetical protein
MSDKGEPIRFVRGLYKGKTGWLNKEKGSTECQFYVIVSMANNKIKRTRVNKESVAAPRDEMAPSSYAEALLQQHPDLEEKMDILCRELAKCKIQKDAAGIYKILNRKIEEAIKRQSKKSKAVYREVIF